MKKVLLLVLFLAFITECFALKKVVFTPRWTAQAQFAGYYVAKEKGFYKAEGLDVAIKHMKPNSNITASEMLRRGTSQIICLSVFEAIEAIESGLDLVNFLQTSQKGGLVCVANFPVNNIKQFEGKKVGTWSRAGNHAARLFFSDNHINVNWIPFMSGINLFLAKAIDATLLYSYNEYLSLIFAKGSVNPKNIIRFSDIGYNFPEDGLYVERNYYDNNRETVESFRRATIMGWDYCREHREEALKIIKKYTDAENITTNNLFQKFMLDEILKLQENNAGRASFAPISEKTFTRIIDVSKRFGLIKKNLNYNEFIK